MVTSRAFSIREIDGVVVIKLYGYVPRLQVKELREIMLRKYAAPEVPLVLNLEAGEIGSLLISIFFEILDKRDKDGSRIAFCHADPLTQEALRATGITSFVQLFATEAEALSHLGAGHES